MGVGQCIFAPLFILYPAFLAGIFLAPPIIGYVFIRADANRADQPGWLWALSTIFLSWIAVLAYLIVRYLDTTRPARPRY